MKTKRRATILWILLSFAILLVFVSAYFVLRPLPQGLDFTGPPQPAKDLLFLSDTTFVDEGGQRRSEQRIFDEIFRMIEGADTFILIDMFLFNPFQGAEPETHRQLSGELTERLMAQKRRHPHMQIVVITDPFNTLYGGVAAQHLEALEAADISVTYTDLTRLRDSNPTYSGFWRLFIRPFGNGRGSLLPNPVGDGRVSLRSYLALLNFKANHRKVVIADRADEFVGLVTSANPHDGSSAHGNVALRFIGPAVADLLETERAVLALSGGPTPRVQIKQAHAPQVSDGEASVRVVTERAVERALLDIIGRAGSGDEVDLGVFYLSDRHLVAALKAAQARGVRLRLLLDPNKDAFGRTKNGVPNRPVGRELHDSGVAVRWCDTHGEQCHAKFLQARYSDGRADMVLGSSNFTRRNLHNLNLESSIWVSGPQDTAALQDAAEWFEQRWHNSQGRHYSTDYATYADDSLWHSVMYRFMEATGFSTF